MQRREFLAAGASGLAMSGHVMQEGYTQPQTGQGGVRDLFPRLATEHYLNAAFGTPLGAFTEAGIQAYLESQRLGPTGRENLVAETASNTRGLIARLIGAQPDEIGFVHCTKAGEQVVLDGLEPWRHGRNIVTNDLHFSGSLHNLIGLRRAGADVRIVRNRDWDVSIDDMRAAIDDRTALVALTLVSNVTGRVESVREIADIAHGHGALVYADVIQAAGIVRFDVRELGVDFAASAAYKWLYGVHGAGFLYVRQDLQGSALPDRLFPGRVRFNYPPWTPEPDPHLDALGYQAPSDATRYQPGHVSYVAYAALERGIEFVAEVGVQNALDHSVRLNRRLLEQVDQRLYRCISPHIDRSPIVTFICQNPDAMARALQGARVAATLGVGNTLRIAPAVYNNEDDIDALAEVMNAVR